MESSPSIGSMHWLLHSDYGLEDFVFSDPTDDLSRLVGTSTCSTLLEGKASMSLGDMGRGLKEKQGACEVDSAKTILGTSSEHPKVNSLNISFGHPESYENSTPFLHAGSEMRSSLCTENVQAHAIEGLLSCMENELYPNVTSRQPMYCSDIGHFQALGRLESSRTGSNLSATVAALTKKRPHSSLSSIQGGLAMQDTSTLSKIGAHIKAERNRREKLNQRFIALSAIVPGLTKVDKATILGDAVKYMKQLEEQIKLLQDKVPKMVNPQVQDFNESPRKILDKKAEMVDGSRQPDIEARVVGKTVLIHVHCDKIKSVLVKALEELEKLKLSIINANVLSFSNMTTDLTFTAQIGEDNELAANDIVKALQTFFKELNYGGKN